MKNWTGINCTDPDLSIDKLDPLLISLLSSGGDERVSINPVNGLNRYFSAPYPRKLVAYASSTANDLSMAAFDHLRKMLKNGVPKYVDHLNSLRQRIKAAYSVQQDVEIVFAPSGTDLEYVALAANLGKAASGVHNILLGTDEVGSGCKYSANGQFFASHTAVGLKSEEGEFVEGFENVSLVDVPVRNIKGEPREGADITSQIADEIVFAQLLRKHCLVHVVHGSKTGLILPELSELDYLMERFGSSVSFIVDACQARITSKAINDYLDRGAIVCLTGSKFMGGAPFNGWALVPTETVRNAVSLPVGLKRVFRQAEFPKIWRGQSGLEKGENKGLALRFEGSIFELERFNELPAEQVLVVLKQFEDAINSNLVLGLGAKIVKPFVSGHEADQVTHPIEMRTLVTLDVSHLRNMTTWHDAKEVHGNLAKSGVRLGQPVKCVRLGKDWGGTIRIGLSMPQIVALCSLSVDEAAKVLKQDMSTIASALQEASELEYSVIKQLMIR